MNWRPKKWGILNQVLAGPLVMAFFLILAVGLAAAGYSRLQKAEESIRHTYSLLGSITRISSLVVDMETGVRGFVLTSDDVFLDPYRSARSALALHLQRVRSLLAQPLIEQPYIDRIESRIRTWQQEIAQPQIEAVLSQHQAKANALHHKGKVLVDEIRTAVAQFRSQEEVLLEASLQKDASFRRSLPWILAALSIGAFVALFMAAVIARRIANPIEGMANAADLVASGNHGVRLPVPNSRELARTSNAFNAMAATLEEAAARVKSQNEELQTRARDAEIARSGLQAILDTTSEVHVLLSPEARFLSVNKRFDEFFGLMPEEVLGKRLSVKDDNLHKIFQDTTGFLRQLLDATSDPWGIFEGLLEQYWPQRRELLLLSAPVRSESGELLGRLYSMRDVSREREAERVKSQFVSMVSHELRTPLTSIKGFVDLILDGETGPLNEEQQEFLTIVQDSTRRLGLIIDDLLDISHINSGRLVLDRKPVDITPLVQGVAQMMRLQLEQKRHQLDLQLAEGMPLVFGDPARLTQIVTNLMSNAVKYTLPGGRMSVRTGLAEFGNKVQIEVEDTGVGMTPDELAKLFSRFFRAKNPATQHEGGTGLGLVITRSLVEMHGGNLEVSSTSGVGSTFRFTVPVAHPVLVE